MKTVLALVGLLVSSVVWAAPEDDIQAKLRSLDPNIPILSVEPIDLKGFYAVSLSSGEVLYVNETGDYILSGNLLHIRDDGKLENLTEERMKAYRVNEMNSLADSDMVIYPAKGETKARVRVFTDIDCPYCRKLHEEVPALNEMGIEVAYVAFPRRGPDTPTGVNMSAIWCAGDQAAKRAAMEIGISGSQVAAATCDSPVEGQFMLGQRVGVTGTPAIVLADGRLLPGYMPAVKLKQLLEQ